METNLQILKLFSIIKIPKKLELRKNEHWIIDQKIQLIEICIFDGTSFPWYFIKIIYFAKSCTFNRFLTPKLVRISLVKTRWIICSHPHDVIQLLHSFHLKLLEFLFLFYCWRHLYTFSLFFWIRRSCTSFDFRRTRSSFICIQSLLRLQLRCISFDIWGNSCCRRCHNGFHW